MGHEHQGIPHKRSWQTAEQGNGPAVGIAKATNPSAQAAIPDVAPAATARAYLACLEGAGLTVSPESGSTPRATEEPVSRSPPSSLEDAGSSPAGAARGPCRSVWISRPLPRLSATGIGWSSARSKLWRAIPRSAPASPCSGALAFQWRLWWSNCVRSLKETTARRRAPGTSAPARSAALRMAKIGRLKRRDLFTHLLL
jgi:hypothetical protein